MNIKNEQVNHIKFGSGVITEVEGDKILVQFQDDLGVKAFAYPEAFKMFLEAANEEVQNSILEKLYIKQEQSKVELEEKRNEEKQEKAAKEEKKILLAEKRAAAKLAKAKDAK